MSRVGIEMQGMKRFERAIDDFEKDMIREVKRVVAETASKIEGQAKALVPVSGPEGGNLRRSIETYFYKGGLSAEIRVGAFYGVKRTPSLLVTMG